MDYVSNNFDFAQQGSRDSNEHKIGAICSAAQNALEEINTEGPNTPSPLLSMGMKYLLLGGLAASIGSTGRIATATADIAMLSINLSPVPGGTCVPNGAKDDTIMSPCLQGIVVGGIGLFLVQNPLPLVVGLGGCLPKASAQQRIGDEFQVNTYINNSQEFPSVASFSNGDFVVTWQSYDQDGDIYGVYGQLFDVNAKFIGAEIQINTYAGNRQVFPSIASFRNNNFVVTWSSMGHDGSSMGIYGQLFDINANRIGNEFQVNTYTINEQYFSSVESFRNNNFVVVWQSNGQDGSGYGIYGQLFNGNTTRIGNEFQINTYANSDQLESSVASFSNGNFVVIWQSSGQDGFFDGIYGQLFDGNTSKLGAEFQINTYTANNQRKPSVAPFSNENFVVTWESNGQDGSNYGVYGQLFDINATKIGSEFQVNTYAIKEQWYPSVTSFSNDNFVITWQGYGSNYGYRIYGQLFDRNANKIGNEFRASTYDGRAEYSSVANFRNGNFVVIWQSRDLPRSYGIYGQLFEGPVVISITSFSKEETTLSTSSCNTEGSSSSISEENFPQRIGNEFQVNTYTANYQNSASVASFSNGNFVVTWDSDGQDGSGFGTYGQLFDGNSNRIGNEFQVNTDTNKAQMRPSVASFVNGNFVVTWDSNGQDGSGWGIYAQLFDGNAIKIGNEFRVNTYTANSQGSSSTSSFSSNNFVVTWYSYGQDYYDNYGIFGQLFNGNGTAIGNEFQVNTYAKGLQGDSSVATFDNSNFIVTWHGNDQNTSNLGIYGQLFDKNGIGVGNEFQINTYADNDQRYPSVSSFSNGNFVVAWVSLYRDGLNFEIHGQLFDENTTRIGNEFQINTYTSTYATNYENGPSTAIFSNGNFVVTWNTYYQNSSNWGVYGQLFNGNATKIGNEFQINSYMCDDRSIPSVASFINNNFVVVWHGSGGQSGSDWGIDGQLFANLPFSSSSIVSSSSEKETMKTSNGKGGCFYVISSTSNGNILTSISTTDTNIEITKTQVKSSATRISSPMGWLISKMFLNSGEML